MRRAKSVNLAIHHAALVQVLKYTTVCHVLLVFIELEVHMDLVASLVLRVGLLASLGDPVRGEGEGKKREG